MVEKRDINIIINHPIDWDYFRDKTILVTGATGRLGLYLVEAFCEADLRWNLNMRIVALARNYEKLQSVFGNTLDLPNVKYLVQDITEKIMYDASVDIIFHTAGLASPRDFTDVPVDTLWGHVQGTRNVLEFAREKKCQQVFYVSTVEVYGEWKSDKSIRETDMGPMQSNHVRSCYPEAKRLCEAMLAAYAQQYKISYKGVRMCHTVGPGISLLDGRAFAEFIKDAIDEKDIILKSDGSAMRTYTYVADAVAAMLIISSKGNDGMIYNVANVDNLISIRDLAVLIANLYSKQKITVKFADKDKEELSYLPFKLAIMDVDQVTALGWIPQVNLEDTFRYTMNSFLQKV